MWEKLSKKEFDILLTGKCPDCGGPLLEGPSGGISTNLYCGGLGESRFNFMGMFGAERITDNYCRRGDRRFSVSVKEEELSTEIRAEGLSALKRITSKVRSWFR